jgi:hypothetical protein
MLPPLTLSFLDFLPLRCSNWPTIPQLYINEQFVGGCDIVNQMHQNGDMTEQLQGMGAEFHDKTATAAAVGGAQN